MLKQLTLSASALALLLALPAVAQETTTEEAPAAEATEAPATEATPAEGEAAAPAEAPAEAPEGEAAAPAEGEAAAAEAAPATPVTRDTVVASVNGTDITIGEVLLAAQRLPAQYQQLPPDVLFQGVVDQLVQQELLAQAVTEEPGVLPLALANERRSILANAAIGQTLETAVTDEALQAAYDAQYGSAEPGTEWNASHILVATEEEAQAAIERIEGGEDFAAVAQELSTDTGSGAQGGELGWFGPGMMVPEFETGVSALEPGQLSAPIQSQFGWHVIRLNETRPQEAPTLDAVRPELEAQLQQEAIQARLTELEGQAQVTRPEPGQFDPAVLADPSILED